MQFVGPHAIGVPRRLEREGTAPRQIVAPKQPEVLFSVRRLGKRPVQGDLRRGSSGCGLVADGCFRRRVYEDGITRVAFAV
jgi:hypothetical protein